MQRILIPLFFVMALALNAQTKSRLYADGVLFDEVSPQDTMVLTNRVNNLIIEWINEGYYFSGVDSVGAQPGFQNIYLHKGEKFKSETPSFRGSKLQKHMVKQLKSYNNSGYPFASIKFDSVYLVDNELGGKFRIDTGPEISYDSAYFISEIKTNRSYVFQLLDIVPGESFSERNYKLVSEKVKRSPFLSLQRPADLSFSNNKAKTFLDLREDATSTFQGVVGLQQVQDGKTTAVGALELDIQNLFRSGKQLRFAWERFAEQSQNLEVYYKHPFILGSKISPSFAFEILKQDTTFLSRRSAIGIHTFISSRIELLAEYESTNGTLLTTSIEALRRSGLADFKRRVYGLKLSKGHLSLLGTRAAGTVWDIALAAGNKTVDRNLSVPDTYYDSIQIESTFYRVEATLAYQLEVAKRQTFFHHIQSGFLQNDQLLKNERYRIGGLTSLRGFNEKNFFVDGYVLSRAEFRSFFEDRSYAYVFYDQLFLSTGAMRDQPLGIGLGFALETSAGQFSFALAMGKSDDQQFAFDNMKAHFGYVSRF